MSKTKWLNGLKNSNDSDAQTWRGGPAHTIKGGDTQAKRELLAALRKQAGLPSNHSFVAPTAAK
jgi:hypothetical protein